MTTQPPNTAAGEHFADAERILAALPIVKAARRAGSPRAYLQTRAKYVHTGGRGAGGAQLQLTAPSMDLYVTGFRLEASHNFPSTLPS
jgi:hypothetical protein